MPNSKQRRPKQANRTPRSRLRSQRTSVRRPRARPRERAGRGTARTPARAQRESRPGSLEHASSPRSHAQLRVDPLRSTRLALDAAELRPDLPVVEDVLRRSLIELRLRTVLQGGGALPTRPSVPTARLSPPREPPARRGSSACRRAVWCTVCAFDGRARRGVLARRPSARDRLCRRHGGALGPEPWHVPSDGPTRRERPVGRLLTGRPLARDRVGRLHRACGTSARASSSTASPLASVPRSRLRADVVPHRRVHAGRAVASTTQKPA